MKTALLSKRSWSALAAALALAGSATAATVSFNPSSQTVGVGDTATVQLVVSGLGDGTSPSLGAWAVSFDYDPAVVSFSSATFGTGLDLGIFGSLQFLDGSVSGNVLLDEVSFEDSADLNAAQPDSFVLATINFTALAPGSSPLSLTLVDLSDELGESLDATGQDGVIRVRDGGNGVPEGSVGVVVLAFLWAGMLGLARRPRRRA
ncbi:MAG: cohesin domain-containing protein [Verrucomicrobiales bacterium]